MKLTDFLCRRLFLPLSCACRYAILAILVAGLASAYPAHAQDGTNGTDGTKGAVGNPGTAGTAGTNGTGTTSGATVTGGFGGKGGAGGDAAANSSGNDGNNGGMGGNATSTVNANGATAIANGGRPGNGGPGSNAANNTFNNLQGGNGGNAGITAATPTPTKGDATATATAPMGDATATATADGNASDAVQRGTAGSGGDGGRGRTLGGNGGNGTVGGDATATATAQGAGGSATAGAVGGIGGSGGNGGAADLMFFQAGDVRKGGNGGDGKNGGNATAEATAKDGPGAVADAKAGDGGSAGGAGQGNTQNGALGSAGNGGTAKATATATNTNGDANAVATAQAGSGGLTKVRVRPGQPPDRAIPGNATATATAKTATGDATATPTAINGFGKGGTATAKGTADGRGGLVDPAARTASSAPGSLEKERVRIANSASSPIPPGAMGQVQAEAMVGIAAALPALKPNTTLNAFAAAVGEPLLSDVLATSAGKPNVISGLGIGGGAEQLGLLEMGGLYPNIASGAPAIYTAAAMFSFDPDQISGNVFRVGLEDAQWTGNGFDLLQFQITSGGTVFLSESFTSLLSALSFFDDHVIDIGSIEPDALGLLDLGFNFGLTAHVPGDGFAIDLAIAQVQVPAPPSWLLLLVGAITVVLSAGAVRGCKRAEGLRRMNLRPDAASE
jgi:hypothetical protein